MNGLVLVACLVAAALAVPVEISLPHLTFVNVNETPLLDDDLMAELDNTEKTWTHGYNDFKGASKRDGLRLLGTLLDGKYLDEVPVVDTVAANIPESFDARTQWPGCVHPIRNQEQCGSCWAFGATEALSDRFAIQSNLSTNIVLAPQDLVSCDNQDGNMGCNGGYPIKAWQYMMNTGVPTDDCYPYTSGGGNTGACSPKIAKGECVASGVTYANYKAASAYAVAPNVAAIQTEIMTHGPIEVAFEVYQDFFSYTSGVYQHKTGGLDGGHAVKMIGWGTLNGTPYWTVANSWGTTWGIDGFFLILRGVNECGIEAQGVAGLAHV